MANINKIRVSGTTYDIQDINAPKVIELTQSEYDSLTTKDPNAFYVITDSEYNFDGYWTSAQTQSAITQSVSGKADTSAVTSVSDSLTAHTANTTVHVTAQDKTNWNNKSDFSGDYDDLTNKPTIPTVPTNVSDFTNDAGYITSDDISGKQDVSGMTAYTTTATTNTLSGTVTAHTADTTIHVTSAEKAAWNAKSDFSGSYNDLTNKLSAGTNVSIVDNVISAEGGGGKTIVGGRGITVTSGETADTVSFDLPISATTNGSILIGVSCSANRDKSFVGGQGSVGQGEGSFAFGQICKAAQWSIAVGDHIEANIMPSTAAFGKYNKQNGGYFEPQSATTLFSVGNGASTSARHNAFEIRQNGDIYCSDGTNDVKLQDTITATAANTTALGGLKLVKLSQSEYDNLATKDSNTLYIVTDS